MKKIIFLFVGFFLGITGLALAEGGTQYVTLTDQAGGVDSKHVYVGSVAGELILGKLDDAFGLTPLMRLSRDQEVSIGLGPSDALLTISTSTSYEAPTSYAVIHGVMEGQNARTTFDTYINGINGSIFQGRKARGTAVAPLSPEANDSLSAVLGDGWGTTGFHALSLAGVLIRAEEGAFTDTSAATKIVFMTSATTTITPVERMVLSSVGNLGIGTTSPYARLSVAGQVAAEIFTATSTTGTSTFPNVNITTGVTLFGSTAASANAFCVILTGSADLCDGSDAGGAGGAQTPWTSNINAATFGVSGLSYVTASSTTATSSFNILSIGSTTPSSMDMFSVGSSSPLMSINGRSGKIGFGTTNESPAKWAFGSGLNVNINPNINLLVQDQADARLGAAVSDNGIFLKAPTSDTGAAGIFAFNYQGGTAMDINLQEFGAKIGIGTSTPWAKFSVVPSGSDPAMVIATTTAWNSTGFYIKEQISSIFSRNWWTTFIGGATSTDRYDRLGSSVTIFGRLNSDTLIAQVDPISSAAFVAGLTADSVVTAGGPGWVFDDLTDGHLTTTSLGTTSVSIGGGGPTGITNGCNDGGAWLVLRANEATGATANDGAWVRGSGEFDVKNTVTGVPAAIPGGMLTSTGTPVMEVTICTPHMTTQAASSTILAPASYAFGFGDHVIGAGPFSSTFTAPNNAAALVATNTENWILLNKNTAASASAQSSGAVQVDTGISTSTTLTSPQTFRIAMTATSTYAYRYNSNTGLWDSIGVNTTQQTKRNFTWFIGVQKPGVAAGRNDLMFRNLKVWYSPQYRF